MSEQGRGEEEASPAYPGAAEASGGVKVRGLTADETVELRAYLLFMQAPRDESEPADFDLLVHRRERIARDRFPHVARWFSFG